MALAGLCVDLGLKGTGGIPEGDPAIAQMHLLSARYWICDGNEWSISALGVLDLGRNTPTNNVRPVGVPGGGGGAWSEEPPEQPWELTSEERQRDFSNGRRKAGLRERFPWGRACEMTHPSRASGRAAHSPHLGGRLHGVLRPVSRSHSADPGDSYLKFPLSLKHSPRQASP